MGAKASAFHGVGRTMQNKQEAELIELFRTITNAGDRRFVMGTMRKVAAWQAPQKPKPALRLILGGEVAAGDEGLVRTFSGTHDLTATVSS